MEVDKKYLLINSSLPGEKTGGGVVKDETLQSLPKGSYVCFALIPLKLNPGEELPESLKGVPVLTKPLYPSLKLKGARFYLPFIRFIGLRIVSKIRIGQIVRFGKKHKVNFIWGEFQGDSVVLVESVSKKLNIPFAGTVWDDPEGWLDDGGYDKLSKIYLWKKFKSALINAEHISTAGEAMQSEYKKKYGVNSVILRHGFDTNLKINLKHGSEDSYIKIGFAGSVYARQTWAAFLDSVALLNINNEKKIKIIAYGNYNFPIHHSSVLIENRGRIPIEEVLNGIAETDFCYLPYWFEEKKRRHCELSFPNKFETYIAAGKPIFYHGPEYAGIKYTIEKYRVGINVHTLDTALICKTLSDFIVNSSSRKQLGNNARNAFISEFNKQKMIMNFHSLFIIPINNFHNSI